MSDHNLINPPDLMPAVGFAHAVRAAPGNTIWLGGQTGCDREGKIVSDGFVEQFDQALANLAAALTAADAKPAHLVQVQLFVTDAAAYRDSRKAIGAAWRRHLGRHYPAMALFEVKGLFDPAALVEIMAVAVTPT